jgi:2-polyprenyl-3-methyl-5-hydroxy-6-metoxy-1,4-benzoquinol methylase
MIPKPPPVNNAGNARSGYTWSMSRKDHWESVYESKTDAEVSWTQDEPRLSLSLIHEHCPAGRVIDVGGGTSVLADRLVDDVYDVAVLDISATALQHARHRLGDRAAQVQWIVADVTHVDTLGVFDVWHDRAVFHFLTDPADRAAYVTLLSRTIRPGGHAVIATFALDGPQKCSGLDVRRYDAARLAAALGDGFELIQSLPETHRTPWGKDQSFVYGVLRRV